MHEDLNQRKTQIDSQTRVPEILAPAGGREQFFAALNSGADAVFLGLKTFNARARADNFTFEDLGELVPLAHAYDMKVLVTLNVLIKDTELDSLVNTLAMLEELEVDAIIVQDLGVARIVSRHFPGLRMHASTQMAVHNLAGVRATLKYGFKRVVLARELTALEMKKIRQSLPPEDVEIEAFCHGSLCYSYSGLCFFSGAQDARSGNRGECAYTCRKPYRILNEPGQGFLFSMKDLNTVEHLDVLVDAGIDTLKIEGRKKDAKYVSTVVRLYRNKLDELFGRKTLRASAPEQAHALYAGAHSTQESHADIKADLALTFQRETTSLFLKGRYHENVIDLDNPTHKGVRVGEVLRCKDRRVQLIAETAIERFDGLRIDPKGNLFHAKPQHGDQVQGTLASLAERYDNEVLQFSARDIFVGLKAIPRADAGTLLEIEIPGESPMPQAGDVVFKTRSDELRRRVEKLSSPPPGTRLRAFRSVDVTCSADLLPSGSLELRARVSKYGSTLSEETVLCAAERPRSESRLAQDAATAFEMFGDAKLRVGSFSFGGDSNWFVPRSLLKELKQKVALPLEAAYTTWMRERVTTVQKILAAEGHEPGLQLGSQNETLLKPTHRQPPPQFAVKCDRLETIAAVQAFAQSHADFNVSEIVFEPKRAFLGTQSPESLAKEVISAAAGLGVPVRLAFPTVIRAWDEPLLKRWFQAFAAEGVRRFEIGNIGAFDLLKEWNLCDLSLEKLDLASDFTLYALNTQASHFWADAGVTTLALSVEDDLHDLRSHLAHWPWQKAQPQAIVFKDTPLFIAESCSLTALHNGCPTAAVCGYRTLEIENTEGERFFVAHENCKSVVYGQEPFAITHKVGLLQELGVSQFRLDFLTRAYTPEKLATILACVLDGRPLPGTHTANFERKLL